MVRLCGITQNQVHGAKKSAGESLPPLTTAASCGKWSQDQATIKEKLTKTREEIDSDVGRRWVVAAEPKPKTSRAVNTIFLIVVLAALCVAVYLNRARIGALWQQITGKAPPVWVMPEKPEHEGPEIEGRDF